MTSSLEKIVIDWMSNQGPPEWHGVAFNWNWDLGLEPLLWIVDQPTCDKATALTVFWLTEPFYHMDGKCRGRCADHDAHRMVYRILGNWNQYRTARFEFRLPEYVDRIANFKLSKECLEALQPVLINTDGQERYPNYGQGGPAECYIAYKEMIGEPITDLDRETLEHERAGKNLSPTKEDLAAARQKEWEEWFAELGDIRSTVEKIKREDVAGAHQKELEEFFAEWNNLLSTIEELERKDDAE